MAAIDSVSTCVLEATMTPLDNAVNQASISDPVLGGSNLKAGDATGENSANGTLGAAKSEEVSQVNKHKYRDEVLGTSEIRKLIAMEVALDSTPFTRHVDVMNLRLASKLWDQTIMVTFPDIKQCLFQYPVPTQGLPVYKRPESPAVPLPRGNLLLSDHYRTQAGHYLAIKAADVHFNPVFQHILFRFHSPLPGAYPRVHDMVKIKLGDKKPFTSFWFWVTNQSVRHDLDDPYSKTVEINVKTNSQNKFGRVICDQFVSQPPIREIKVTFLCESPLFEGYRWVVKVAEPTGVRVWHILQALLDAFDPEGNPSDLRDLYQHTFGEVNTDNDLGDLPPLPDDSDEDLNEASGDSSESC